MTIQYIALFRPICSLFNTDYISLRSWLEWRMMEIHKMGEQGSQRENMIRGKGYRK